MALEPDPLGDDLLGYFDDWVRLDLDLEPWQRELIDRMTHVPASAWLQAHVGHRHGRRRAAAIAVARYALENEPIAVVATDGGADVLLAALEVLHEWAAEHELDVPPHAVQILAGATTPMRL